MHRKVSPNFTSASVTDRGLSEKRPQNEDSYLEISELGLFAVADGVGGAQAGDVASQMAVEVLGEAFSNQPPNADAEDVMRLALERANSAIFQMASDLPQLSSMATTMVALHLAGDVATIGHVGDSRLYRIDPRGTLHRETADHSVVEEEVRAGRMTADQALNHPSRNVISRALGAEASVEVELKTIMVEPGTMFMLCSDGITRHIPDREIEEIFADEIEPVSAARRLKEICFSRGAEDNLTAIVIRLSTGFNGNFESLPKTATDNNTAHFDDFDSETVATARHNLEIEEFDAKETFEDLNEPRELDDESYLSDELSVLADDKSQKTSADYISSRVAVPATPITAPIKTPAVTDPTLLRELADVAPANTVISYLLPAKMLLTLGAVIGAGAFYLLQPPPPEPVQVAPALVEKSPDVSLTAFEESRRLIDQDPTAFINANAASAQVPEDYYLLGRAFLLSGKYWEAKRAFVESRNRLAQADPKNSRMLAAEIAMAVSVIESPGAAESFAREIAASNTFLTNSNVNTAGPAR